MNDPLRTLETLRRPRLLIRAARIGAEDYRRNAHLHRVLGATCLPRSTQALQRLIDLEADLDMGRRDGSASYSISRHIEVLIAMMGEARLLRAAPVRQLELVAV